MGTVSLGARLLHGVCPGVPEATMPHRKARPGDKRTMHNAICSQQLTVGVLNFSSTVSRWCPTLWMSVFTCLVVSGSPDVSQCVPIQFVSQSVLPGSVSALGFLSFLHLSVFLGPVSGPLSPVIGLAWCPTLWVTCVPFVLPLSPDLSSHLSPLICPSPGVLF